jgi:four helix bundle protein
MSGLSRVAASLDAMSDYKKLQVWQKAHSLSLNAHRAATAIKGSQYSAFRNQIIRAAMSIPTNIVEGREQKTEPGFARYLRIALASTSELEYHLRAALDIGALGAEEHESLAVQLTEVRMMLHGLLRRVESEAPAPRTPGRPVPS